MNTVSSQNDSLPSWPILGGFFIFCLAVSSVIFLLTPFTYQLDDIKYIGIYSGGSLCLVYWAALWTFQQVKSPPRIIWGGYFGYLAACFLSTIFAASFAQWIGWQYLSYYTATLGFVLLGSAVIQTPRMCNWILKYWVLVILLTTGFGLVHYFGILEKFYYMLYPENSVGDASPLKNLLYTFINSRSMLSTILNVQFFGNFLLMLLPINGAACISFYHDLKQENQNNTNLSWNKELVFAAGWLIIAGLCLVLSFACIFTTFSKSSILVIPVIVLLFLAGSAYVAGIKRIPYLWLMITLGVIMAGTLLYFVAGDLRNQLKDMDESMGPRQVIFGGALSIFHDNPLFGGGPGSFRIIFPQYRSPDYHLSRISNVTLYAHNWLLDLLAETGALGALAYLAFLGGLLWLGWKALKSQAPMTLRLATMGGVLGVIALLMGSFVTPMTRWPIGTGSLHAMIGTALGIALLTIKKSTPNEETRSTPLTEIDYSKLIILLLTVVFCYQSTKFGIRQFRAAIFHNTGWQYAEYSRPYIAAGYKSKEIDELLNKAEQNYQKALELDPTRLTTYYRLASVYNNKGDIESALKAYTNLQKYAPDYSEIHYNLGVIHFNKAAQYLSSKQVTANEKQLAGNELELSLKSFKQAAEQSNKISIHYYYGTTARQLGKILGADTPEGKEAYNMAGEILENIANLPTSTVIQEKGQVETETELRYDAAILASDCYEKAANFTAAAVAYTQSLENNPTSLKSLQQIIRLYSKAEEPEKALELLNSVLEKNPVNPEALMMKVYILSLIDEDASMQERQYLLSLDEQMKKQGGKGFPDKYLEKITP
jgi:O-antigen ligase/tetratricopeptide (TPR) repeat protein